MELGLSIFSIFELVRIAGPAAHLEPQGKRWHQPTHMKMAVPGSGPGVLGTLDFFDFHASENSKPRDSPEPQGQREHLPANSKMVVQGREPGVLHTRELNGR